MIHQTETEIIRRYFAKLFEQYPLIEEFTPLRWSRLWSLNTAYWGNVGLRAFTNDLVPSLATSDGSLSTATAELIAFRARRINSEVLKQIAVVEIGPGSGLFARGMMRHYMKLKASDPRLPSLLYVAVDSSLEMLKGLVQHQILTDLGCETILIEADLTGDLSIFSASLTAKLPPGIVVMCVCNYSLDSLPATTLQQPNGKLLEAYVELRAQSNTAQNSDKTSVTCTDFIPGEILIRTCHHPVVEENQVLAIAKRSLTEKDAEIPFNDQAMAFIRTLVDLEVNVDMILVNDYRVDDLGGAADPLQFFSGSIAMGLHFPTIDAFVAEVLGWVSMVPAKDSEMIVSRLFTAKLDAELQRKFSELFSLREARRAHLWTLIARNAKTDGRFDRSLVAYEAAFEASPLNWSLLLEIAHFVQTSLGQDEVALQFAKEVLEANPLCAKAWNIIGDCHYKMGDRAASRSAFEKARQVQTNDARALLNLSFFHMQDGDLEGAMSLISQGLVVDRGGPFTNQLLERQQEIISFLGSYQTK